MAEFKTRLFIFCVGRLLKWAESIEQKIPYDQLSPVSPVDDSKAVVLAESTGEREVAARLSGPPEHWARLVSKGPPQHWLDLIKEKAPHLLSPDGNQLVSPLSGEAVSVGAPETNQEVSAPAPSEEPAPSVEVAVKRSEQPFLQTGLRPASRRDETKHSAAKVRRTAWLNRLRFQPAARLTRDNEPAYVSDSRTREAGNTDSSSAAGGAAAEGIEATLLQPRLGGGEAPSQKADPRLDRKLTARETITRLRQSLNINVHRSDRISNHQAVPESAKASLNHRDPNWQESFLKEPGKQSRPKQITQEAIADTGRTVGSEASPPERVKTQSLPARSNVASYPPVNARRVDPATVFTSRDQSPRVKTKEPEEAAFVSPDSRGVEINWPGLDFPQTQPPTNHRIATVHPAREERRVRIDNGTNYPEPNRSQAIPGNIAAKEGQNRFASVVAEVQELIDSNRSVWPTLPPAPTFDIADEVLAREGETEGLRRLEQEQRGNP